MENITVHCWVSRWHVWSPFSLLSSSLAMREPNWMALLGRAAVVGRPKRRASKRSNTFSPTPRGSRRSAWNTENPSSHTRMVDTCCLYFGPKYDILHRSRKSLSSETLPPLIQTVCQIAKTFAKIVLNNQKVCQIAKTSAFQHVTNWTKLHYVWIF